MYFTIFKFESQEFINLKATSNFFSFVKILNIFDTHTERGGRNLLPSPHVCVSKIFSKILTPLIITVMLMYPFYMVYNILISFIDNILQMNFLLSIFYSK